MDLAWYWTEGSLSREAATQTETMKSDDITTCFIGKLLYWGNLIAEKENSKFYRITGTLDLSPFVCVGGGGGGVFVCFCSFFVYYLFILVKYDLYLIS